MPECKNDIVAPNADLILALSNLGTQQAEELIIKYMKSENSEIRRVAVIGARTFNSNNIVESLNNALQDDDWEVRLYAEEVLEEIHYN